ncbi:trigger factor [Butyrivibrio sp. NC3005]|uniref:trigger factor n=1 Tax=Butyrivibrio sp. NC3005 TaxID=1280685 RepID=UPI0003F80B7C|nr:trigger factor [Butyrivibrio sp. NC3005]
MKRKLVLILLTALTTVSIAGCKNASNGNNAGASNSSLSTAQAGASNADNATGSASNSAATAASVKQFSKDAYLSSYKVSDYITLGEYKGIEVEVASVKVSNEDVEASIKDNYLPQLKEEVKDRAIQKGDTANIDYVGKYADTKKEFDGGSAKGYDLSIGSGTFIPGFEDGLVGAKKGEVKDLKLTFPKDYKSKDLAGKEVVFTVTVNSISTAAKEVTDKNVAQLGIDGVKSVKQLRVYVKKDLESKAQSEYDNTLQKKVIDAVVAKSKFSDKLPEPMVERYIKMYNNSLEYYATMYSYYTGQKLTGDEYLKNFLSTSENEKDKNVTDLEAYKKDKALEQIKATLVAYAIAEAENLKVTDKEIEKEITTAASSGGYSDSKSYTDYYTQSVGMDVKELIKESLLDDKAVQFLAKNAKVVEPKKDKK